MHHVMVLHGPNLNALGAREPDVYGSITLAELEHRLHELAKELGCALETLTEYDLEYVASFNVLFGFGDHRGVLVAREVRRSGCARRVQSHGSGVQRLGVALNLLSD